VQQTTGAPGRGVPRPRSTLTAPMSIEDDPFTEFVRDTYVELQHRAGRMCRDDDLAKDLVQETYIKIERSYRRNPNTLTLGYAHCALGTVFVDHFRKESRERRKIGEIGRAEIQQLIADPGKLVTDQAHLLWLMGHLGLRPRQQEVYFLWVHNFKPAEIGELLGLASGTVSNYLIVIKERLKEHSWN